MTVSKQSSLDELKNKLKQILSIKIVDTIADKSIPYAQIRDMSIFVTDNLPQVKSPQDLSSFIEDILTIFPFLKHEIILMRNELGQVKEEQVMEKLRSYISNYSIK